MNPEETGESEGSPPVARRLRATYAFAGATTELARTVPVVAGEDVLLHGAMRLRRAGRLPRPVALRLTARRLSLLLHYALQPDRVWDVPRAAVRDVRLVRGTVRISWSDDAGGTTGIGLTRWTGRPALDTSLRDVHAVADVLTAWLDPR
jgi:hypothetical protein